MSVRITVVKFKLHTNYLFSFNVQGLEIGKGILFSDSDTLSQNSKIIYEILNDYRQLVEPKCQAFEVKQFGLYTSAINCSKL